MYSLSSFHVWRKTNTSLTKKASQRYDIIIAGKRSPYLQSATMAMQQGRDGRKVKRTGDSPAAYRPAGLATVGRHEARGAWAAYTLTGFCGNDGTGECHPMLLHHVAMPSVMTGYAFCLVRFAANTMNRLTACTVQGQTTEQHHHPKAAEHPHDSSLHSRILHKKLVFWLQR